MCADLWSADELRLFRPFLCMADNSSCWKYTQPLQPIIAGCIGLVALNRQKVPDMTLQQCIDNLFGIKDDETDKEIRISNAPAVVRVHYVPGAQHLSFDELSDFAMPIGHFSEPNDDGEFVYHGAVERYVYRIIAAVRLRTGPHRRDFVRTYQLHGEQIVPDATDVDYVSDAWSVKSANPCMLFYGIDPGSDAPSVATRETAVKLLPPPSRNQAPAHAPAVSSVGGSSSHPEPEVVRPPREVQMPYVSPLPEDETGSEQA
ncbi:hypothetical protein BGZ63DRAFT_389313 [Mariannaea sp. PMI_226]|nr:hypothetical protein BGZ63DRAFT_389313 [Mariannaea sp. PMI_226]